MEPVTRALLIDDDRGDFILVRRLLQQIQYPSYAAEWAPTPEEGLTALQQGEYDICLVDYYMGEHTGMDFLKMAQEAGCGVPIILLTGSATAETGLDAMRLGAADFLNKQNLTPATLARSIGAAMAHRQAERAILEANKDLEKKVAERTRELEQANRELERQAAELQQRAEQLAEADRRKDEFLAMLAHELRNPLSPILNAVHLLKSQPAPPAPVERASRIIERQATQMARLIDDLLEVSRILHGKIHLHPETIDLCAVVTNSLEGCRNLLDSRQHRVMVSFPEPPVLVHADPLRMEQVVANLVTNAAKYTEPGGLISITGTCTGDEVALSVRDNGAGIPPELLPKIFEPFVQLDQGLERSQGGLGVGLTLVQALVQMHGGTVEAHSEGRGQGSEFVVRLSPGEARVSAAPSPKKTPAGGCQRVLVVDDNVDAAQTLGEILELWGHEVHLGHDGLAAVRLAQELSPTVVLLDIGMPGMSGYQVVERLRQDPVCASAFIAALTGYGQEEDRARSRQAGFDVHLTKPVDLDQLQQILSRAPADV